MPPSIIIRRKNLPLITGLSLTTIWRLIREKDFPAPFQLSSKTIGFDKYEIDAWIEARMNLRVRSEV
jgi:prophage regulatory protein